MAEGREPLSTWRLASCGRGGRWTTALHTVAWVRLRCRGRTPGSTAPPSLPGWIAGACGAWRCRPSPTCRCGLAAASHGRARRGASILAAHGALVHQQQAWQTSVVIAYRLPALTHVSLQCAGECSTTQVRPAVPVHVAKILEPRTQPCIPLVFALLTCFGTSFHYGSLSPYWRSWASVPLQGLSA